MNCWFTLVFVAAGLAELYGAPTSRTKRVPLQKGSSYLRLQVLLDRAHFSPGEIDGVPGANTTKALRAFRAAHGLRAAADLNAATLRALTAGENAAGGKTVPPLVPYTVTEDDVRGPFVTIPKELMEQASLPSLDYQSPLEKLGEKFHINPKLLTRLNKGKDISSPGVEIQVPNIREDVPPKAARIVVSKSKHSLEALNAAGRVIAEYPTTSGSEHDPLPLGSWKVTVVNPHPVFYYNPDLFWNAPESDAKAKIQPGPNNPVGVVWIGISKEHYGIHGTPEPSLVGHAESHGCIRLTNWDAAELAKIVVPGTPVILKE
jgi:lipoprotein-anchoring transpeptidase ErfK/SrfK